MSGFMAHYVVTPQGGVIRLGRVCFSEDGKVEAIEPLKDGEEPAGTAFVNGVMALDVSLEAVPSVADLKSLAAWLSKAQRQGCAACWAVYNVVHGRVEKTVLHCKRAGGEK